MTIYLLEIAAYAFAIFSVNIAVLEYKKRHRNHRPDKTANSDQPTATTR